MMENNPGDAFQRLRPICVKLSKQPTRSGVQDLRNAIDQVKPDSISKLLEYLLFPLQLTLQRPAVSNELKQDTVECIEILLRKVRIGKLNLFDNLFKLLTVSLSAKEPGKVANISEELKFSIITCLNCLIDRSCSVIRSVIYCERYLPSLGHAVSLLLAVAEYEKSRNLRVVALSCLRKISHCDREFLSVVENGNNKDHDKSIDRSDGLEMYNNVCDSAASAMASFLPGISMTLARIICADTKQGHVIFTSSIDYFGDLVSMVMNDRHMQQLYCGEEDVISTLSALTKLQVGSKSKENQVKDDFLEKGGTEKFRTKTLKANLNKEWFKTTASKLQVLMEKLTSASTGHSNGRVRLSVVEFCEKILVNCTKSMSKSAPLLIDVLVGFSEDEYNHVSLKSKAVLESISKKQIQNENISFANVLEENLHRQLTALPRLMKIADDKEKLRTLNVLNGYIHLLGDKFSLLLISASHLKRLSLAFVQVLELDVSDVGIVEERTSSIHESAVTPSDTRGANPLLFTADKVNTSQYPRYRFKYFTDDKVKVALFHSLHLLGCHGNLALLVDNFLDIFNKSKLQKKQAVLILNKIILGSAQKEKNHSSESVTDSYSELKDIVKTLLSTYTSGKNWNVTTSNTSVYSKMMDVATFKDNTIQVSYKNLNSNIQLMCLLLEGIGVFACVLQQDFNIYLIETLYLVLSKLGDSNAAISRSAYGTLVLICQYCGYSSVEDLITHNADYLVNSISSDFKYVFVNEQSPRVLQVMLQYSNSDILTIIEDTLNDIFTVLDLYPDHLLTALVKVLNTLLHSLHKWFIGSKKWQQQVLEKKQLGESCSKGILQKTVHTFAQKVRSHLQQYIQHKHIALGDVEIKDDKMDDMQPQDGNAEGELYSADEKIELPQYMCYSKKVLEKCIHFLSGSSVMLRILVLDTVCQGILILKDRENELLPMIHLLWSPLINRLSDIDQAVIIKAVDVIATMAECSGDFMRRRVIKDVIPKLFSFLEKQANISIKAGPVYTHCQAFKVQVAFLEGLKQLCKQLEISELDLDATAHVCSLYLNCRQPVALQQAAVQAFEVFSSLEPDAMWLLLNNLYCPGVSASPHHMFTEVKLAGFRPKCKEFATNVIYLLSNLDKENLK